MIIQPIDYFLVAWFALALLSTAYVAWDQFRGNPEPAVMKWGFVLVTLYMGPIGLLLYVLADKEPRPGTHEEFASPLWKQGVGSTIHCVAGDATGIIVAAVVVAILGLPMWLDLIIEYVAGFAFGLLIFQSLFMMAVIGGGYWENVRKTFVPEFISMNAMMAGMAPVMAILMMGRDMRAMDPTELLFWGVMSIGVIAGFVLAYPFNVWMVAKGLKHGLMTDRGAESEAPERAWEHRHHSGAQAQPSQGNHQGHGAGAHGVQNGHSGHQATGEGSESGHSANGHEGHMATLPPAFAPTRPQIAAMAGITTLMLAGGFAAPMAMVNMSLSAHDVGGVIMPPGMIMDFDTPGESMRDMGAIHPRLVSYEAPADARGDQVLEPRIENGVKVFDIEASVIRWNILGDETVEAYAYNNQVPGPRLALVQGDRVRINFTNRLPESTTVHWHGLILPNEMDGPAEITQEPIPPGGRYTYAFDVIQSGTYFYHTHDHADRQQALGLYGALLIEPRDPAAALPADYDYTIQLQEWLKREWLTYPAMLMEGALPNFFTINGKAYPATETIRMRVGETVKLRFVGSNNNFIHPMHVHGGPFQVLARDGETLPEGARFLADTVNVGPGQRYDVIWTAQRPGKWIIHCHIPHHTTNNNVEEDGAGGLTMIIDVAA
ncbi:MAG: multicopper oxidase domain-containing protein [Rhizobiales bacterium]|nr:multicopper oxidase domain-containing protein [Hyphomicrobiales bacterium]